MDIVVNILIAAHLMGLVLVSGSGIAMGVVMPFHGQAGAGEKSVVLSIGKALARNGHIGLGLLWVTGPLVVWLKYGGVGAFGSWFWIKMALVVTASAAVGIGSAAYRRFAAGDTGASGRVAAMGRVNLIVGPLIVLTAVFAFG